MKLFRTDDIIPLVVVVPAAALALLLGYWGVTIALRAFDPAFYDNTNAAFFIFGGFMLAAAAIPGGFAVLIARAAGWRILIVALPLAVVLAVVAQIMIEDASRRSAQQHIKERQRDSANPPVFAPPGTPPIGPLIATPSLGAPR